MSDSRAVRDTIAALLVGFSGQQNTLTIPRPYITLTDGDVLAALLLSQIIYWSDRTNDPDGWFAKSYPDWGAELGLSEYQVRRSVNSKLKPLGVETKRQKSSFYDNAPTLHYRVNMGSFSDSILEKFQIPILRNSRLATEETQDSNPEKLDNAHSEASLYVHSLQTEPTAEHVPTVAADTATHDQYQEAVREALQFETVTERGVHPAQALLQIKLAFSLQEVQAFGMYYRDRRKTWSGSAHIRKAATIEKYATEFRDDTANYERWMAAVATGDMTGDDSDTAPQIPMSELEAAYAAMSDATESAGGES